MPARGFPSTFQHRYLTASIYHVIWLRLQSEDITYSASCDAMKVQWDRAACRQRRFPADEKTDWVINVSTSKSTPTVAGERRLKRAEDKNLFEGGEKRKTKLVLLTSVHDVRENASCSSCSSSRFFCSRAVIWHRGSQQNGVVRQKYYNGWPTCAGSAEGSARRLIERTSWMEKPLSYLLLQQRRASSANTVQCVSTWVTAWDLLLHPFKDSGFSAGLRHKEGEAWWNQ